MHILPLQGYKVYKTRQPSYQVSPQTTHMSNRPTYVDYSSPSSERSVYFDAPIMHFFSKSTSKTSTPDLAATADDERVPSRAGTASPVRAEDPSVAFASTSVAEDSRTDNTEDEASRHGVQLQDAPVEHQHLSRRNRQSDDSGYGSPRRSKSLSAGQALRAGDEDDDIKPIPILWSDTAAAKRFSEDSPAKRASSMRSFRSQMNGERVDAESIRTDPLGRRTPGSHHRRASLSGGSFVNGPGTVGPNAELYDDASFRQRSAAAEMMLSKKQKLKIGKSERVYSIHFVCICILISCQCS